MYLNFLIYFVLLCSAHPSNSFANKIALSSQRKQLKRFDSSFTHGDAIYEVYYFPMHHLVSVGNNVNWRIGVELSIVPALSFRMLQKASALVVSVTVYVTYRKTSI